MTRFLLCFIFLFAVMFGSLSQVSKPSHDDLIRKYREADHYYILALKANEQNSRAEKREALNNKLALKKFQTLERALANAPGADDSIRFITSLKLGELNHYFDSLQDALRYYQQAIALKNALPQLEDSLVFKSYIFSGHIYYYQNQLDSATFCFQKAEAIQQRYKINLSESQRLYNDLGVLHFQGGNYRQAGNYFRKASESIEKSDPDYEYFRVNYAINYAISLFKLENYDPAALILKQLLSFNKLTNEIHNNLGLIYEKQGKLADAIIELNKVAYHNRLDIGVENDRAAAWLSLGNNKAAEHSLQSALKLHQHYNGSNNSVDHGLTLKTYGDLKMRQKEYLPALQYYQQAMHQFYPSFSKLDVYENPLQFSGVFSYPYLFTTLVAKAAVFHALWQIDHNIKPGQTEIKTYESAFQLVDYIDKVYDSDEARLFVEKTKYMVHDKPIEIAIALFDETRDKNYLEKAFRFDQKNKASVLAFNESRNRSVNAGSNKDAKERQLRAAITRLSLSAASSTDPEWLTVADRQIRDLEIALGKTQDLTADEKTIPIEPPSVKQLQRQLLDDETMLISYHVGEKNLTIFSVSTRELKVKQKPIYPAFFSDLEAAVRGLHGVEGKGASQERSERLAAFLLGEFISERYKRLIIIPDDELNYLPFESLKLNGRYVIQDVAIQYQYSTLLLHKENVQLKNASVISFAPFTKSGYTDRNFHFNRLSRSARELQDVNGSFYNDREATKQNFLANISGKKIIHLATHAVASDSGTASFIVFAPWNTSARSDYLLYAPEIYNLSLKDNELIILSACETGSGKLVKGEGVMSLSRAFAYAGCANVITSLWKADDEATAYLVNRLHFHLRQGLAIDQAMQKAKVEYLSDRSVHPRKKAPAYWANLIYIGNYEPARQNENFLMIILSTSAALLLGWFITRYFLLKNKNQQLL